MKKRFIVGFICGALLFGITGVFAGQYIAIENTYPVQVNGNNVDLEGYQINDYTYFKLRDIGNKVGFNVDFQNDTILINTQQKGIGNTTTVNENNKNVENQLTQQAPAYITLNGVEYIAAYDAMVYVQKIKTSDNVAMWDISVATEYTNGLCTLGLHDANWHFQEICDFDSVLIDGKYYITREVFERDVLERIKNYKY